MGCSDATNVPVDLSIGIFHIEPADFCLLRRSHRAILSTECFHLIEVFSPLRADEVGRPIRSKLRRTLDGEGPHVRDPWKQRRYRRRRGARSKLIHAAPATKNVGYIGVPSVTGS